MTTVPRTRRFQPRRRTRVLAGLAAAALAVGACTAAATPAPTVAPPAPTPASSPGAPASGGAATVKTASHSLGTYLTGPDGKALYLFTKDSKDASTCTGQCATNWPPLTVTGSEAPKGDTGVTGTLATITRADGGRQVTYNGVPLYAFGGDTKAGDTNGQGVNNVWYLVGTGASASSGTITGGLGQGGSSAPTPTAAQMPPNNYEIRGSTFPATISVTAGTTVTWVNRDTEPHTVTAEDGSFDSKNIASGGAFQHTFSTEGSYTYRCEIHSSMRGTVTVGSAGNITY